MSKNITRIYPIRHSRSKWFIRLYANHDCEKHVEEKCIFNNRIEDAIINLSQFNTENPLAINGKLINSEDIVIKDKKINISFDYPMINSTSFMVTTKNGDGFTLTELVNTVKKLYQNIYKEESETATEKTYELEKLCVDCLFDKTSLTQYLNTCQGNDEECPICYHKMENEACKIRCGHAFHKQCITEWIGHDGKTCPLCRTNIKECEKCGGKLVINYSYTGKVIPIEQRGFILNRNLTNGKYGIYGHDFEDLHLDGFWYDKKNKNVRLFMSV